MKASDRKQTRRVFLGTGAAIGAASLFAINQLAAKRGKGKGKRDKDDDGDNDGSPFQFTPFTRELPIPPVLQPVAAGTFNPGDCFHGIAPEWGTGNSRGQNVDPVFQHAADVIERQAQGKPTKFYFQNMNLATAQIVPGVDTEVFAYSDVVPGPTIIERFGQPIVIRYQNNLQVNGCGVETSVHAHGGHWPAHSDGYPDHYVLPGVCRDYYYPNIVPEENGQPDFNEAMSTMWYHDHGNDITGHNVNRGLVGFYLTTDAFERNLIGDVLPGGSGAHHPDISGYGETDIPLAVADKRLNADGSLFYDFLDHNGQLGDIMTVNGIAQPFLRVQRRKYRLRILPVGTARTWAFRLSKGNFITIGSDSWLLTQALDENIIVSGTAQRLDVVVDFSQYANGEEVYLQNVMQQEDGRGPDEIDTSSPMPLMKFIVEGPKITNDVSIEPGTQLRPITPINPEEVVTTRRFEFERGNGAWKINDLFFNPERADAVPRLGSAERWILENSSGGWWHPIHIHLESHHVMRHTNGNMARARIGQRSDTTMLGPNGEAEILMKFRTYTGPFVFHCHNLEHEDMRMMSSFDPRPQGETRPLGPDGFPKRPVAVTGNPEGFEDQFDLFEEKVVDHDRLRDRDQDEIGEITTP